MINRIGHVDIAKGISIILVAVFHSKIEELFPKVIEPMSLFRMPLFFFLSGVFFSAASDPKAFIWKKFDALLKPYFVTLIVVFIISGLLNDKFSASQLKGIIYGNGPTITWVPLWFLTHLFAVYCFVFLIFKFSEIQNSTLINKLCFLVVMMVIGVYFIDMFWYVRITIFGEDINLPGLPFSFDIILVSSSFFIMGVFLRQKVIIFKPNLYLSFLAVLFFFIIVLLTEAHIDLNMRYYNLPLLSTIGAVCGIYIIITMSFYINKIPFVRDVLLLFGSSSLFVLIFHLPIGLKVYQTLSKPNDDEISFMIASFAFLSSIGIPLIIKYIISKNAILSLFYLPLKSNIYMASVFQVKNLSHGYEK